MEQQKSSSKANEIPNSAIISEGKTKRILSYKKDPSLVLLEAKDKITAFNTKQDVIADKAQLATETTCNVFELLKTCGIPVAFEKKINNTTFLAPRCEMILYEVVVRREAHGSYLKRARHLKKGHVFPQLIVEFFLKTSNKTWKDKKVPSDDPFIQFQNGKMNLFIPNKPLYEQEPFLVLDEYPLKDKPELFTQMEKIAKQTFLTLEKAWQAMGRTLVDFKVEFGFDTKGNLLLSDVIDNDSWRLVENGSYIDKQRYRNGDDLKTVKNLYQHVCDLTKQFTIPRQQIILWRGSVKDDVEFFKKELEPYVNDYFSYKIVTISMHKSPAHGYHELHRLIQQTPDSVLIAYIGRSNGAGPTLSANTNIPTITVPASWKSFPCDVWSSLRTPSNTPVMTVLEPSNALLAALNILSMRNPAIYSRLRLEQEERLTNLAVL